MEMKRSSMLSTGGSSAENIGLKALGGYALQIDSENSLLGHYELVFFDPPTMAEQSTGAVIIFHGVKAETSVFEEWSRIAYL